jgi:HAD superfamily hydrolase (TIGR01450 family)
MHGAPSPSFRSKRATVGLRAAPATIVVDLDGVVWLSGKGLPGASEAIALLRDEGFDVLFATNNSSPTTQQLRERLARIDIAAEGDSIVTSAHAAALEASTYESVHVLGEVGVEEAMDELGLARSDDPAAVVVGWSRTFTFEVVAEVARMIRRGGAFIATNDDATHPTPEGLLPGTGSLVAAIATAAETSPTIAGKPGLAMARLVRQRRSNVVAMIGDRPATDGQFAKVLAVPFGLVDSAATPDGPVEATWRASSLQSIVEQFIASSPVA